MLQELGYALLLEREADTGKPIVAEAHYRYIIELGALAETLDASDGLPISGKTLLDMAADDYRDAAGWEGVAYEGTHQRLAENVVKNPS